MINYIDKDVLEIARPLCEPTWDIVSLSKDICFFVEGHKVRGSVCKDSTEFKVFYGDDTDCETYEQVMDMKGCENV